MANQPAPAQGAFCWVELGTTDAAAAKKFYADLLGWRYKEGDVSPMAYTEVVVAGRPIGGIYQSGPEYGGGAPPHWMAYVSVDDVDASARRVEELGGKVRVPPMDIPEVGRFCVISDPQGASLALITLAARG